LLFYYGAFSLVCRREEVGVFKIKDVFFFGEKIRKKKIIDFGEFKDKIYVSILKGFCLDVILEFI